MKVLFLTDNFPPEGNAPATRTFEHTREWVKMGHDVTVMTGAPNFPEGKVFEGFKNKWFSKEINEGVEVRRVKTYITANEGFFKRTLDFVSFMISSFVFGLFVRKVDVVIGTSPQFFTVLSAWALAKLKRVPFVFELRDIWPASITAVGAMKKGLSIRVLEKIEMFLYRQADLIVSVTHSFKEELIVRGIDGNKIVVVLNGVDLSKFSPHAEKDKDFMHAFGLNEKFVVGYIGTHGLAHALDKVIECAELMASHTNVQFVLAGGGADRNRIVDLVTDKQLTNVTLIPRQEKSKMPQLWSICDVSLVSLKNSELFTTVIPSKIFESMGMGLPILISCPAGEATSIVENFEAGLVIAPESPVNLSKAILELESDREKLNFFKKQSFNAASNFDREALALVMLDHLLQVVKNSRD
ncbi:MAG: glycosyltransferase family 4 protein [Oceanospirillaceae bacterium]|nr:glycosyltransferase family 4 protein [Oceanospirillaceae bacterium]